VFRVIGIILIIIGVIGALGVLGEVNPISLVSDPLFNLTKLFLDNNSSFLFWCFIGLIGFFLSGPKEGYIDKVVSLRR